MRDSDAPDRAAGADDAHRRRHRLLGADTFENGLGAEALGELADASDTLLAALANDVGGAELPGERNALLVTTHDDDLLGAEPLGGEDTAQPDRAVADDRDRAALADA